MEKSPYFEFENLLPTERLAYEILDKSNYQHILRMFKDDENPFVQKDYQERDLLEKYVDYQLEHARFAPKRASCDWLFKSKDSGTYIGLLNLYDLSRETFNDNHRKCMIGFTTRKEYRRQYYTTEAVRNLIEYAISKHDMLKIIASTDKKNAASQQFLQRLDFTDTTQDFYYADHYDFFTLLVNENRQ